jgi:hypothetical protein
VDQTTTIVALIIDLFDDDGGGKTKPTVIIDGETYRIIKLRPGAVVPQRQSLSLLLSYHPLERAYWLRSKLRGAIYGRMGRGTVLRCLDQPVHVSADVEGSAVVEARWMSTTVHVVIKEMSRELVGEHRSMLAVNPIKEVIVMQYLQAFVGDRRETQAGGGGMTRTTLVMDMEGRARPILPADPTLSALAGSVSLAKTTQKRRVQRCMKRVIIKLFINDSFYLMKCS